MTEFSSISILDCFYNHICNEKVEIKIRHVDHVFISEEVLNESIVALLEISVDIRDQFK